MADADTARLCIEIVHAHFGPLAAKVSSILLTRGRLPMPQIVRFSALKPRTVRAIILSLVQHNLLWHAELEIEGEVLEFNEEECLMRLRFGRFITLAGQTMGEPASHVVSTVLKHGKLRQAEMLQHLTISDSKESSKYLQAINTLVTGAYLKPSTKLSHISKTDRLLRLEANLRKDHKGIPTAKDIVQWKIEAEAKVKREDEDAERIGMKRKAKDESNHRSNKRKIEAEDVVDETVYFRVNHDKFNIHIRNNIIEQAARERFNNATAIVLRATLNSTEAKQRTVDDVRSDPVSVANISMHLSGDDDLASGIALTSSSSHVPSTHTLLKEYLAILACADNPTPAGRAASFVSVGGGGTGKVQVEFEIICRRLRQRVLEAVARERYGDDAVRIIRVLLDTDKMDEKHVTKVAMLSHKDVRPLLSSLSSDSLISLQEIPKGNDRNPARTFYLWFVDLKKAYSVLLGNIHKTLFNIISRRLAEEEDPMVKSVLEKRARSDVMNDESLLTRTEREILREFESRREKLSVLERRVEEVAFILRDLAVVGQLDVG
ncbi:hypothetical protein BU17DRAFT_45192 [Hysterangium stoloniferum]|nr:hypothetical protein BU17DRAFT_45192 [Hysterangium stoloniferum]